MLFVADISCYDILLLKERKNLRVNDFFLVKLLVVETSSVAAHVLLVAEIGLRIL